MNRYDQMRILGDLAQQLYRDKDLTPAQRDFLAIALYRISTGEDANKVFNVNGGQGFKLSDAIARRRMSVILHWVAGAMEPVVGSEKNFMTLDAACEEATSTIVPAAKAMFPGADGQKYDAEYIKKCWNSAAYRHMRSPDRSFYDPDFPYYPLPPVKTSK